MRRLSNEKIYGLGFLQNIGRVVERRTKCGKGHVLCMKDQTSLYKVLVKKKNLKKVAPLKAQV